MFRTSWKQLLMVAALVVVGLLLSSNSALACHGHWARGGWSGCGYAYGYGYGWASGPGYGWGYGCNPGYVYTSSYCSPCATGCGWGWNSCWNSGWSSCYRPACGVRYGRGYPWYGAASSCCGATAVARPTVAGQPVPLARTSALELAQASQPKASSRPSKDGVLLSLDVPEDARVYVDGTLTKTTGKHREYACSGLRPGQSYAYQVRVVVTRNGKELSDTQVVRFRAGQTRDLAFNFGLHPAAAVAALR